MPSSSRWSAAALAGLACSMRSASGPAVLAARGRIGGSGRVLLLLLAAGELGVDKLPKAPNRISPPALAARIASGAYTGQAVAGPAGRLPAAVAAGIGTYATWWLRRRLVELSGRPDAVIAGAEDLLCYGLATAGTRPLAHSPGGTGIGDTAEPLSPSRSPSPAS